MTWRSGVARGAAGLWCLSLAVVGFVVVPLLFLHAESPAVAGRAAARLFAAQAWVSICCGLVLLVVSRQEEGGMDWGQGALPFVLGGMLLAMIGEFGIAPKIVARQNLPLWHTMGSAAYLAQWLCSCAVFYKLLKVSRRAS